MTIVGLVHDRWVSRCETCDVCCSLLAKTSHVVLDEIHERDTLSDFLMIVIRDLLGRRPGLKVVLMSATLNAEEFSAYFGKFSSFRPPEILTELSLCYSIVYHGNCAHWDNYLQLGRQYQALILLGLALCHLIVSESSVFMVQYLSFLITFFTLPFSELSLVGLALDPVD